MRVIIAGSREILNYVDLLEAISESNFEITTVISGGAAGVDSLGEKWAKDNGTTLEVYPAEWAKYGKRAGPVRNQRMAEAGDALIAVMLRKGTRGTLDMIEKASGMGLKVHIHLVDQ